MAQRILVEILDDIDGSAAAQTVQFGLDDRILREAAGDVSFGERGEGAEGSQAWATQQPDQLTLVPTTFG